MVGFLFKKWRMVVVAGLGLALSGCGFLPSDPPPPPRPVPAARPTPPPPPVEPAKPTKPSPPPATPVVKADPAELVGMGETDVRRLLGSPHGERNEGAARVLSYAGGGCTLDVVFFLDVSRGEWAVLSYDLTPPAKRTVESCYGQWRRGR